MAMDIASNIIKISEDMLLKDNIDNIKKKKSNLIKNMIILEIFYNYVDDYNQNEYSSDMAIYKFAKVSDKLEWIIKYENYYKNFAILNLTDNPKFIEKIMADMEVTLEIDGDNFVRRKKFIVKIRIPSSGYENESRFDINTCVYIEEYSKYTTFKTIITEAVNFINTIDVL
jgi:hypothetical protein